METLLINLKKVIETITLSEKETEDFAQRFAGDIKPGSIIGLSGNLGAGKTHFIKGIAVANGIAKDEVVSPTFTIMREYYGPSVTVYHFDFYRLNGGRELEAIGFRDFATEDGVITCVEWPEIEPSVFHMYDTVVKITHIDDNTRKIEVFEK